MVWMLSVVEVGHPGPRRIVGIPDKNADERSTTMADDKSMTVRAAASRLLVEEHAGVLLRRCA